MRRLALPLFMAALMSAQVLTRSVEVAAVHVAQFPNDGFFEGYISFTGECGIVIPRITGNRVSIQRTSLCALIREAYDIQDYRIANLPSGLTARKQQNYFDVTFQAEGSARLTRDQERILLRQVLEDRFQLQGHRDMRELPVYALRLGKDGHKMRTDELKDCDQIRLIRKSAGRGQSIVSCKPSTTMSVLADSLTRSVDRPIVDRTGLDGMFVVNLNWSTDGTGDAPSLFTAVQEQLGLRLVPERAPVEVLQVDRVARPSEN